jgi:hypothetical protein
VNWPVGFWGLWYPDAAEVVVVGSIGYAEVMVAGGEGYYCCVVEVVAEVGWRQADVASD